MIVRRFQFGVAVIVMMVIAAAIAPSVWRLGRADAAARPAADTPETTDKDQVELAVTVYNSNVALVRDVRQLHFALWWILAEV